MQYFHKDNYLKLEAQIINSAATGDADAVEDLLLLKRTVYSFVHYVYSVDEEQIETRFARLVLKGDELEDIVSRFDLTRHNAHESAIVSANILNRMAVIYNVGSIFTGDPSNRREVGHFCGELSNWFFVNRYN